MPRCEIAALVGLSRLERDGPAGSAEQTGAPARRGTRRGASLVPAPPAGTGTGPWHCARSRPRATRSRRPRRREPPIGRHPTSGLGARRGGRRERASAADEQLGRAGLLDQCGSDRARDRRDAHLGSGGGGTEDVVDDRVGRGSFPSGDLGVVDGGGDAVARTEPARGPELLDRGRRCGACGVRTRRYRRRLSRAVGPPYGGPVDDRQHVDLHPLPGPDAPAGGERGQHPHHIGQHRCSSRHRATEIRVDDDRPIIELAGMSRVETGKGD